MADLSVKIGPLALKNPVMTASGTFGYGSEYDRFHPIRELGAVVVKGIAPWPSHGNPVPRIAETTAGMLNAIGLQGPGVDAFLHDEHYLPWLRESGATVIVNIWGKSPSDYAVVAERLSSSEGRGIAALEINVSCPNVKEGGLAFGTDPRALSDVVSVVRRVTKLPLIVKLSPNVSRIADFAKAAEAAGADALSLINTIPAMAIDVETWRPKLANVTGGLSGPAVKPVAVKLVYEAARAVSIPIIGMGGIMDALDAVEFMLAGASAVAVGTATFADPYAPIKIVRGLNDYLDRHGLARAADLVGKVRVS